MTAVSRVLVVDDDPHVLEIVTLYLKKENFTVLTAREGIEAMAILKETSPDLLILDLMLPGSDGLDICRTIRRDSKVPIIMLTARDEDLDKILGLEMGADDYVTKPFNPRELVARVKAVLRRGSQETGTERAAHGNLEVSLEDYSVKLSGQKVSLTPRETEILHFLAAHPGKVFSREHLLESIWGYEYLGDARTVDTHIKRLRHKLAGSQGWEIQTVWGVGYKFEIL